MCIAVVVPEGKVLPRDVFFACDKANRDGAGFAFIGDEGKVEICKSTTVDDGFYDMYVALTKDAPGPKLVHFRIGTQGTISDENCHPFRIKDGALIHNGILWSDYTAKESDTNQFCSDLGEHLTYEYVKEDLDFIGDKIGDYNKMALLYDEGKLAIINRHKWVTSDMEGCDGILFSNMSFTGPLAHARARNTCGTCIDNF